MRGGMAQVWAGNETTAVIDGTSQMHTLDKFLVHIERTFGDPDWVRTAHTQLHELKMAQGIMAEDYTSQFEMLVGRTRFNDAALEDKAEHGFKPVGSGTCGQVPARPKVQTRICRFLESRLVP